MIDYTELKRLAEDAIDDSRCRHDFQMEVTPKVVLSMIAEIDRLRCDVEVLQRLHDEDGIEHNKLRTQNQALREALTRVLDCCDIAECRTVPNSAGSLKNARAALAQAEGGV